MGFFNLRFVWKLNTLGNVLQLDLFILFYLFTY